MWQIRVEDPSGETRTFALASGPATKIGRDPQCEIPLRDPLAPSEAATLWQAADTGRDPDLSPFWIRSLASSAALRLGDLSVREAQLPAHLPLRIGDSRVTLEKTSPALTVPEQPSHLRPWKTQSESGKKLLWTARKAAATPLSLYLAGETGTGKEVLAQLLHAWSDRASGPFVPLHCGALPLSIAESELFGHVKGAFTGAIHQRPGALMQAHGGTLFLDEVGDLPLDIQIKLLRFLENGEIRPVGADQPRRADVRLICATHHPLKKLVEEGKFRRDLFYRIASVTLEIPTLRSRPGDIELLANQFASEMGKVISSDALLRLKAHCWPGNVRELRHSVERACGLAGPFSEVLREDAFEFLVESDGSSDTSLDFAGSATLKLDEMERMMIIKALRLAEGHRGRAAKILGIARSTLFEKLKRHGIVGPRTSALWIEAVASSPSALSFHSTTRSANQISSIRAPEYSRASH